jgi:hypothetical protein
MGNQASKVIEKSKERKEKRSKTNRRRSTITVGSRSNASIAMTTANYDWIDDKQQQQQVPNHVMQPVESMPKTRRQSITEFFSGRKKSIAPDDFKELDRLQRQVIN